jgi:hypothetical protein
MNKEDDMAGAGGTRIQRRKPQSPPEQQMGNQMMQQQMGNQMGQQMGGPPPAMNPRMQQQMMQQQMMQQQMGNQMGPPMGQQMMAPKEELMPKLEFGQKFKSKFGSSSIDSKSFKMAMLVVIIFLMFNSKIIWKQITRFPMMGEVDPSIIALIVNALLAGIVFYLLSKLI